MFRYYILFSYLSPEFISLPHLSIPSSSFMPSHLIRLRITDIVG